MKISFSVLLFLIFLTLQLTGYITWPWIWVFAPLWAPMVFTLCFLGILFLCVAIVANIDNRKL